MDKAFGYVRVSDDAQVDGDGPIRQEEAIRKYCAEHSLELVKVFFEDGVTGKKETLERPAFYDMMAELGRQHVSIVIIEKLDRLSRDVLVQETAIRKHFQTRGCTLISTCEPDISSTDPQRKFIRVVLGAVAELDRDSLTYRMQAAKARIRASGQRCEGQKPYTDQIEGRKAMRRILELRDHNLGFEKIAAKLNEEAIPTKRQGTSWHGSTVRKMLAQWETGKHGYEVVPAEEIECFVS